MSRRATFEVLSPLSSISPLEIFCGNTVEQTLVTPRQSLQTGTSDLKYFLPISVCLHVALLGLFVPATRIAAPPSAEKILSVSLSDEPGLRADATSAAPRKQRPKVVPRPKHPPSSKPAVATSSPQREPLNSTSARNEKVNTETNEKVSVSAASENTSATTAGDQIRHILLSDLRRYFEYPLIAQQRGWQGMVWLSVTVQANGVVGDVRVTQSSGHAVLDRSAVSAMRRVGHIAQASTWLNGQSLELPLPVVYQLTN